MERLVTSAPAAPSQLTALIENERRRADVAGVAVAAFDRDGVRFTGGFGYADLGRAEQITPHTLFRAASITKLFTTTLVLQEVEAGRLALDDHVNDYLDGPTKIFDRRGREAAVTIRHLLTHTSGLPVSWRGLEYGPLPYRLLVNEGRTRRSLRELISSQRVVRTPGKRIIYSNGAFETLGYIVARINQRTYEEVLRQRVFDPLQMSNSSVSIAPAGPGIATPYGGLMSGAGRRPAPTVRNYSGPAGALLTSALELSNFGRMVLCEGVFEESRVVSRSLLDEATTLGTRNHPDLDEGLGLGFWVSRFRQRWVVSHDGGLAGVATRIVMSPSDGVGVTVLANGADPLFVHRIAEQVLEYLLGLEPEAIPGAPAGVPPALAEEWRSFTARVQGRYRVTDGAPPGPLAALFGLSVRPRLTDAGECALTLDAFGKEPIFLYPDGDVGRYRIAFPLANGTRAVIEERPNGTHIWASILHLLRTR